MFGYLNIKYVAQHCEIGTLKYSFAGYLNVYYLDIYISGN